MSPRERNLTRRTLKTAARGNRDAFLLLCERFAPLVWQVLYAAGIDRPEERATRARELFLDLWREARCLRRVSEIERRLYRRLVDVSSGTETLGQGLYARLRHLSNTQRFILIAAELEDWQEKPLARALKISSSDLRLRRVLLRCELCDLPYTRQSRPQRKLLRKISSELDGQLTDRHRQRLRRKCQDKPEVKDFKSQWLETRCALIEWREDLRAEALCERFRDGLWDALQTGQPRRPAFKERILSKLGFSIDAPIQQAS